MTTFPLHTPESAPKGSTRNLAKAQRKFGFIPNILSIMADSPATLEGYMSVAGSFQSSSLNPEEQQVVLITTSVHNDCHYCVAAHSTIANQIGVPAATIDSLRDERPLADSKLEALRQFTLDVVQSRGWVGEPAIATFLEAGFQQAQILEVVLGVTQKTLSNYVNHLAKTPLDDSFREFTWKKPIEAAAVQIKQQGTRS